MQYTRRHYEKLIHLIRGEGVLVYECAATTAINSKANPFSPLRQSIRVGLNSPWWFVVAALSHEFGHCVSFTKGGGCSSGDMLVYGFGAVVDRAHALRLLNEERRAWRFGFKFMRDNGMQVGEELLSARRFCMRTHKQLHEAIKC
jgi:hypothetical protein